MAECAEDNPEDSNSCSQDIDLTHLRQIGSRLLAHPELRTRARGWWSRLKDLLEDCDSLLSVLDKGRHDSEELDALRRSHELVQEQYMTDLALLRADQEEGSRAAGDSHMKQLAPSCEDQRLEAVGAGGDAGNDFASEWQLRQTNSIVSPDIESLSNQELLSFTQTIISCFEIVNPLLKTAHIAQRLDRCSDLYSAMLMAASCVDANIALQSQAPDDDSESDETASDDTELSNEVFTAEPLSQHGKSRTDVLYCLANIPDLNFDSDQFGAQNDLLVNRDGSASNAHRTNRNAVSGDEISRMAAAVGASALASESTSGGILEEFHVTAQWPVPQGQFATVTLVRRDHQTSSRNVEECMKLLVEASSRFQQHQQAARPDVSQGSSRLSGSSGSQSSPGDSQHALIATAPSTMLSAALVEMLIDILMPRDPARRQQLFDRVWEELHRYGLTGVVHDLEGMREVRNIYKLEFAEVVKRIIATLDAPVGRTGPVIRDRLNVIIQPRLPSGRIPSINLQDLFQQSRYMKDFVEIKRIGKGAYGSVYQVRHRLDKTYYAVKQILLKLDEHQGWVQVIREVQCLAQLCHDCVVRYNNAWLESHPVLNEHRSPHVTEVDQDIPTVVQEQSTSSGSSSSIVFDHDSSRGSEQASASHHSNGMQLIPKQRSFLDEQALFTHRVVLYIQMELCERTLKEWLIDRNYHEASQSTSAVYDCVDQRQNESILKQILKGVQYIHENDMIHRDLKPGNIFMTVLENGDICAKIGDFGLARNVSLHGDPLTPSPGNETDGAYSCNVGTVHYAAPELKDAAYDEKVDMYSIGVILFELYQPFSTESERYALLRDLPQKGLEQEFRQKWPIQAYWIKMLVSPNPHDRPNVAELLAGDLFQDQLSKMRRKVEQQKDIIRDRDAALYRKDAIIRQKDVEIAALRARLRQLENNPPAGPPSPNINIEPFRLPSNPDNHSTTDSITTHSADSLSDHLQAASLDSIQAEQVQLVNRDSVQAMGDGDYAEIQDDQPRLPSYEQAIQQQCHENSSPDHSDETV